MQTYYQILSILILSFLVSSCSEEEDSISPVNPNNTSENIEGCTNSEALNYDENATIDDGSCIILGCTDEDAINYEPDATDNNGSCEYSNANLLNGVWNIVSLEYSTEIDLSDVPQVGALIGVQTISGEASNAGEWIFQYPDYTYSNNLNFTTEPITIIAFDVPGIPIDVSSNGDWTLVNDDTTLLATDNDTNLESSFTIISLTENTAVISGIVPFSQEIMGLAVDLDIEMEMILEKE